MLRASYVNGHPPRRAALIGAAVIGLATFGAAWWLLEPSAGPQHDLTAVVRQRGLFDSQPGQQELVLARLLGPESLTSAMRESRFTGDGGLALNSSDTIEGVRSQLRVDVGQADEAGMQAVSVRWTGASSQSAARLVNALARGLLSRAEASAVAETETGGPFRHRPKSGQDDLELAYTAAHQAANDTTRALNAARQQFEAALVASRGAEQAAATASLPVADLPVEPTLAPPLDRARDSWFLFRQQLADLDARRQDLSERLMPEHPEMKSLDEKIFSLRSRLAQQPSAPAVRAAPEPAPVMRSAPSSKPSQQLAERLAARGEELAAAQAEYESAANRERAAWQSLCAAKNRSLAEIEPAQAAPPPPERGWAAVCIAALCGLLSGAFTAAVWPVRRLTFSTVEEVRAVTRLPVIAISRHSLN